MAPTSATLKYGEHTVDLPVKAGTIGPSVVDIGKLYGQTGMFTFDPGFTSTASDPGGHGCQTGHGRRQTPLSTAGNSAAGCPCHGR